MPIQYERDDARHRLRVAVTDPFTAADLIASVERQFADGAWHYGLLVDSRAPAAALPPEQMQTFVSHVRELIAVHGPRGPIAIVAREPGQITVTQRYIYLSEKLEPIEVFWALDDAQQWLDDRMAQDTRETPTSD
jgi:hypothetical protein